MKKIIKDIKELGNFAEEFLQHLEKRGASIIILSGDLGSGKTAFVQQIGKVLGIKKKITSPTFIILKKYKIPKNQKWQNLIHVDVYRLTDKKNLKNIGLIEELNTLAGEPKNLILIEWGEIIETSLPKKNIQKIHFEYLNEKEREVSFQ